MPITEDYYYYKMDSVMVTNAISVSGMPDEVRTFVEEKEVLKGSMIYQKGHLKKKYRG